MTIDTAKLKVSTKGLVSAALAVGAFLQIPAVNAAVTPILARHPHIGPLVVTMTTVYTLLHDPMVRQALGIKETVEVKKEVVTIAPEQPSGD